MRQIAPLHATWPQLMQHHQRSILLHMLQDSKEKGSHGSAVLHIRLFSCSDSNVNSRAVGSFRAESLDRTVRL